VGWLSFEANRCPNESKGKIMNKLLLGFLSVLCLLSASHAWAFKSDPFKGAYQIISQTDLRPQASERNFVNIDVDALEIMWARYASSSFPADLEDLRREPAIIVKFTNRDLLFFTLEANALIGNNFMSLRGDDSQVEIQLRPDGQYDLGVIEKGKKTLYLIRRM
jgi:hypothetical protein